MPKVNRINRVKSYALKLRKSLMKKIAINSKDAPEAIGPYSQAIRKGNIIFLSGQIPLDPKTMELVEGIEAQIKASIRKFKSGHKSSRR